MSHAHTERERESPVVPVIGTTTPFGRHFRHNYIGRGGGWVGGGRVSTHFNLVESHQLCATAPIAMRLQMHIQWRVSMSVCVCEEAYFSDKAYV